MSQIKSKSRVTNHGEVFTNEREVNSMLNLIGKDVQTIDATYLEPSCGDGNFLIKVLEMKTEIVKNKYKYLSKGYNRALIRSVCSCYGVELLKDNVIECRDRLYNFISTMTNNKKTLETINKILKFNIINGNMLTQKDCNNDEISFIEWTVTSSSISSKKIYYHEICR